MVLSHATDNSTPWADPALTNLSAWLKPEPGFKVVTPLVRALMLFSAFTPHEPWLGNSQLAHRTGLAPSTITRIARSLVQLGYLLHDGEAHKYRLSPTVLGLGYAAIAHSAIQALAGRHMAVFARQHKEHVCLATRDRLDLVVIECRRSLSSSVALPLHVGMRVGIASSPMGWSLLAALPALERHYLLNSVERRTARDWPKLRRRASEGMAQVSDRGYCTAIGEWGSQMSVLATPILLENTSPLVLACIGASQTMTRARVERELGPRLLTMARSLQAGFNSTNH